MTKRFLLIHNRYYHHSGPETYLFNLKREIEAMGHKVDIFCLDYSKNLSNVNSKYHSKPIGTADEYSLNNQSISLFDKFRVISSLFYRHDVYENLNKLINNYNYDAAIVMQFWGKLSPSVFKALNENNLPYALRISDFGLICGSNTLLKNGHHSEDCINSSYSCIKNKCVSDSYLKSFINKVAQIYFAKKYSKKIKYIFTCNNTKSIFQRAGHINESYVIPTFYPYEFIEKKSFESKKIIFLGRVDSDKGLHNIIELIPDCEDINFEIWGNGPSQYISELEKIASMRNNRNINMMGLAAKSDIPKIMKDSMFSIIPSAWHDNLPNSLIESLSNGVPVIAPNYGCFNEFISHKYNGFLYNSSDELKEIFNNIILLNNKSKKKLSINATMYAKETFNSKIHIDKLLNLF